ncbi:DUF3618 domain-containing protein [Rubrobacter marinus]|uniref:DUF3618 domain-containing protein n=1 Tax=Rubrobacter marinus TaxID=2653852 RepID=A0A6G8PZN8_9ACTN|nr:DUF3618 domain-containing protein [Rubrobacter marinus]QIN79689.1 DUF3618 domain-containing protein [Rubrobacter marinus]
MGERPDEIGRDPLNRRAPLGEDRGPLAGEPGFDPATDAFRPDVADPDRLRDDEVEVTRVEIERTRADMSETANAIQQRLSPENLKEQAKDRVRDATVGKVEDAGSGIAGTIRENPIPAALTGIGLGWLLVSARKQRAQRPRLRRRPYYDYGYSPAYDDDYYPPRYDERGSDGNSAGQALERVGETAGQARDRVSETAGQARDRVEQSAAQVRDKTGELADRTQHQASRLADRAQHQARRAGGGMQRILRENPLATGALAVGLGAAVGLAIPETRKENEVMGEARDNVVEKAQEKAQEAQQKVQRVAEEAQGAAQQEAENQGLAQQ